MEGGVIGGRAEEHADGECGKALEGVGSGAECPSADSGCECVVRVAGGLFGLTLRDRNAGPRRQCQRQVKAARRRDGIIGQAPGCGQIPAGQRGLGRVSNPNRRLLGLETEMGQARRDRFERARVRVRLTEPIKIVDFYAPPGG